MVEITIDGPTFGGDNTLPTDAPDAEGLQLALAEVLSDATNPGESSDLTSTSSLKDARTVTLGAYTPTSSGPTRAIIRYVPVGELIKVS